jgi:hypothetical protein
MSSGANNLRLCEAILELIEQQRAATGDESLGASIERAVLDLQFKEFERTLLEDPGPIEPWLIRRRRGEA